MFKRIISLAVTLTMLAAPVVMPRAAKAAGGDFIIPVDDMPEAGADGFIVPLKEPLPEAGANEFIAPIEAPDPNATVIHTAEELAAITKGSYVLANDIYLDEYNGGVWTPITPTGEVTLDGQG
ncbi:MAG: hypothetical protein ACI38A_03655, partial [Candidatus Ornithomonoglobus sp.]